MDTVIRFVLMFGELILCDLEFWLLGLLSGQEMDTCFLQSLIVISIVYIVCNLAGGRNAYTKYIRSRRMVVRMLGFVSVFGIASWALFGLGRFQTSDWEHYLIYLVVLWLSLASFRLFVYWLVKRYRQNNRRMYHAVWVGNIKNHVGSFHELAGILFDGYRVCGYFADKPSEGCPSGCSWLGTPDSVIPYLKEHKDVCGLYYNLSPVCESEVLPIAHYCENHFIRFYGVPDIRKFISRRMCLSMKGAVPVLGFNKKPLRTLGNRMVKRAFDIFASLLFLCTLFPFIFAFVALVTWVTMPGPLFFRQKRTGLNGKEFMCLKFRSMKLNTDSDRRQAIKNDPRVTRWGHIMRKYNIDELPQFINVLLGEMSVVGPRPHMLKHTEEYAHSIEWYMVRQQVKPGITGWSQVMGFRGETKERFQIEGRVKGDIWYIEHWSLWLDLLIIYKTITNVFHGEENAY